MASQGGLEFTGPQPLRLDAAPRARRAATRGVALLVPERGDKQLVDPFFAGLTAGVSDALYDAGLALVLELPRGPRDAERTKVRLETCGIGGVLVVGLHDRDPLTAWLAEHGIPFVICGQAPRGVDAITVDSDNVQGATAAVEHLLSLGRRTIAMISGNLDQAVAADRLLGYRLALASAKLSIDPLLVEVADFLPERAAVAMERLLLNRPDVDGVFAASDAMAAAAMRVLQRAERRIPADVAVIGFDDAPAALMASPPLSTMRQHAREMGTRMVELLLESATGAIVAPRRVLFPTELIVRESTAGATLETLGR